LHTSKDALIKISLKFSFEIIFLAISLSFLKGEIVATITIYPWEKSIFAISAALLFASDLSSLEKLRLLFIPHLKSSPSSNITFSKPSFNNTFLKLPPIVDFPLPDRPEN